MGAQTIQVSFAKGRRVRAEVVAQDFEVGLALLRVKKQGLTAPALARLDDLDRGHPVVAIASTGSHDRRVAGGLVTSLDEHEFHGWTYRIARAAEQELARHDFNVSLISSTDGESADACLARLLTRIDRVGGDLAGLICFPMPGVERLIDELDRRNIPWVTINRRSWLRNSPGTSCHAGWPLNWPKLMRRSGVGSARKMPHR